MEKIETNEPIDESWWASLLSTEDAAASNGQKADQAVGAPPARRGKPKESSDTRPQMLTADQDVDWEMIYSLMESEEVLSCAVIEFNRGGLLVQAEAFKGFIPVSHLKELDVPQNPNTRDSFLQTYVGKQLEIKVIECDPERGRIVLSERAAQTPPGQRQELFESLSDGERVSGVVTNITDFGIFVDLGGVEGLVHISEISWGRVMRPHDFAEVGVHIEVVILQVDRHTDKISLSIKRLLDNPWASAGSRYPIGAVVDVSITEVVKYGAFARVEEGLEGLIHISEMNLNGFDQPADILAEGEIVVAEILSIEPDNQRLSLRLKQ
jgi:small subunit ribosomal protein S1